MNRYKELAKSDIRGLGEDLLPLAEFGEVPFDVADLEMGAPIEMIETTGDKKLVNYRRLEQEFFWRNKIYWEYLRWQLLTSDGILIGEADDIPTVPGVQTRFQVEAGKIPDVLKGLHTAGGRFRAYARSQTMVDANVQSLIGVGGRLLDGSKEIGEAIVIDSGFKRGGSGNIVIGYEETNYRHESYLPPSKIVIAFGGSPLGYLFEHAISDKAKAAGIEPLPFVGMVNDKVTLHVTRSFSQLRQDRVVCLDVIAI